jgi:hypothetical protein
MNLCIYVSTGIRAFSQVGENLLLLLCMTYLKKEIFYRSTSTKSKKISDLLLELSDEFGLLFSLLNGSAHLAFSSRHVR